MILQLTWTGTEVEGSASIGIDLVASPGSGKLGLGLTPPFSTSVLAELAFVSVTGFFLVRSHNFFVLNGSTTFVVVSIGPILLFRSTNKKHISKGNLNFSKNPKNEFHMSYIETFFVTTYFHPDKNTRTHRHLQ